MLLKLPVIYILRSQVYNSQKICLNIDTHHQQIYNSERFAQISVVITDYAMPEMDGVDFLRQIKHSEIKRILLTGVADEKIAVKAFNWGTYRPFFPEKHSKFG